MLENAKMAEKFRTKLRAKLYTKLCTKFYTKFYTKLCTKLYTKFCTKLCTKLYAYGGSTRSSASGPRYIPDTRASAKYTPYIHLGSHLIFYPSFLTSSLPRGHQNDSQQTTVAGAGRPLPEPDDHRWS